MSKLDYVKSVEYENYVDKLVGSYGWNENKKIGTFEELKEQLLYKRVVEWNEDALVLDNGTLVTIEMSEWDCCASAGGHFSNVKLDAAITDVVLENVKYEAMEYDEDEGESTAVLKLYHNQNEFVAASEAGLYANSGNGGYYYSVASILIKDVFYPVLESGDGEADE